MWLIVRSGPDAGTAVEVTDQPVVLGRQQGCDLVIRDTRASRRHLELAPVERGLRLRDLESANGTYLDGSPVREATLEGGEEIRIGAVMIEVWRERPDQPGEVSTNRPDQPDQVPTYSAIRRIVDHSTRRTRRVALVAAGVAGLALVALAALLLTKDEDRVPEVVARLGPATALVITEVDGRATGSGSGFVLDAREGLVVTNAHVVNEGTGFRVTIAGRERDATLAGVAAIREA